MTRGERILVFGGGGTLGRAMVRHVATHAPEAYLEIWDRVRWPLVEDRPGSGSFEQSVGKPLRALKPDVVFNFAVAGAEAAVSGRVISVDVPCWLGAMSAECGFRLVHTSSVMVFSDGASGPFAVADKPDASSGYGLEKRQAEEGLLEAIAQKGAPIVVARIGWQIGSDPKQNTMRRFLEDQARETGGRIRASGLWIPSCSRLEVTVDKLWSLRHAPTGLYQIEGNQTGLSFAEIVSRLREEYDCPFWEIEETSDFQYNQMMVDPRVSMPPLFET